MKKVLSIFLGVILSISIYGKVRIVSTHQYKPGQYVDLQQAIDESDDYDTVYVYGTPHNSNRIEIKITKALTLIGSGYNIKELHEPTMVRDMEIYDTGSGSVISGFNIGNLFSRSGTQNILIERCKVNSIRLHAPGLSNWNLRNNILENINIDPQANIPKPYNIELSNNIIGSIIRIEAMRCILANNVILYHSGFHGVTVINNIFYGPTQPFNPKVLNANSYSTFNNNLNYNPVLNKPYEFSWDGNSTLSFHGNLADVNPLFASIVTVNPIDYFNDYHLSDNSPAKNAGTDGTDLGIYGGKYPFPIGGESGSGDQTSALPKMPIIQHLKFKKVSVTKGEKLRVSVSVMSQR